MPHAAFVAALSITAVAMVLRTTPESSAIGTTPESSTARRNDDSGVMPASCRGERLPAVVRPSAADPRLPARPMWLWDSPKVLLDATARAELFAFCTCQGIDALWMQVALER